MWMDSEEGRRDPQHNCRLAAFSESLMVGCLGKE